MIASGHTPARFFNMNGRFRVLKCILIAVSFALRIYAHDSAGDIDTTIVFKAGVHTVSRYVLDKYYHRFEQQVQRTGLAATSAQKGNWMQQFLAEQVLEAAAQESGYFSRPEVRAIVARTERYMLTQPNGPFYARLVASAKPIVITDGNRLNLAVVHFSGPESEESAIGRNFARKPDLSRRLLDYARRHTEAGFEGWLVWPYSPYEIIASEIERATPGEWSRVADPDFGVYWILVQDREQNNSVGRISEVAAEDLEKDLAIQRRRRQVLRAFRFAVDAGTVARFVGEYHSYTQSSEDLPKPHDPTLAGATLFTYRDHLRNVAVTADEFRVYFNQRFVRKRLNSAEAVIECAEDFLCEEIDYRAAMNLRLDKDSKFVQDRDGFAGFQALDLYEKEHILPTLGVTGGDVENYYRQHMSQFELPTKVSGNLVTFEQREVATKWLGGNPKATPSFATRIVVSEAEVPPGLEFARDNLLQCAVGKRIGPYWRNGSYACFEKTSNIATRLIDPEVARQTIRALLTQDRLHLAEIRIARELAAEIPIVNNVPYGEYGITHDR